MYPRKPNRFRRWRLFSLSWSDARFGLWAARWFCSNPRQRDCTCLWREKLRHYSGCLFPSSKSATNIRWKRLLRGPDQRQAMQGGTRTPDCHSLMVHKYLYESSPPGHGGKCPSTGQLQRHCRRDFSPLQDVIWGLEIRVSCAFWSASA